MRRQHAFLVVVRLKQDFLVCGGGKSGFHWSIWSGFERSTGDFGSPRPRRLALTCSAAEVRVRAEVGREVRIRHFRSLWDGEFGCHGNAQNGSRFVCVQTSGMIHRGAFLLSDDRFGLLTSEHSLWTIGGRSR